MVLPLLGLLALGGAAALHPYAKNRNQRMQGEYIENQAAERGIDLQTAGPDLMRSFGLGTGTLGMPDAQRDVRTGFEGVEERRQSDINSRRSAGVSRQNALDRLALEKLRYANDPNNPTSEFYIDPLKQWEYQQDYLRENPSVSEMNAQERLQFEIGRQERADKADKVDAYNAQQDILQPLINADDAIIESLYFLDEASFNPKLVSSQESLDAAQYINETLDMLRSDYWQQQLRRSDAPADQELKQLLAAIPRVGPDGLFGLESSARGAVKKALALAQQRVRRTAMQANDRYRGAPAQSYSNMTLGDDWKYQ